jgi:hypothetical protein
MVVPNVTRIIGDLYDWSLVPAEALEHKRQIGSAVHSAIELDLRDDLDISTVDSQAEGYFEAWRRFRLEKRFNCCLSECWIASRRFRYAGTLDLAGDMDGSDVLIDAKTTDTSHPGSTLQTAAYLHAASEMGYMPAHAKRFALYLRPNGAYRLEPHPYKNDFTVFLSCLSRYNWQVYRGLIKAPQ